MIKKIVFIVYVCLLGGFLYTSDAQVVYSERKVNFNLPDGVYNNEMLAKDFGNGKYMENWDFAEIENNVYKITYLKGLKVRDTGAAAQLNIEHGEQCIIEYDIKYDDTFENGLHGKQFGFGIGVNYTGGRAEEARENGDGGSVRLQFDAHGDSISNQLYVYYNDMTGKYGNNPGNQHFSFPRGKWNTIKMLVCMQSDVSLSDGKITVWCNGDKKIEVNNLRFVREESARKISKLLFAFR